jgi:hypothetical protein
MSISDVPKTAKNGPQKNIQKNSGEGWRIFFARAARAARAAVSPPFFAARSDTEIDEIFRAEI